MLWGDARSGLIKYNGGDKDKANKAYWISVVLSKYRAGSFSLLWSPSLNVCVSVPTCYAQLAPSSNSFCVLTFSGELLCKVQSFVIRSGETVLWRGGGGSLWMFLNLHRLVYADNTPHAIQRWIKAERKQAVHPSCLIYLPFAESDLVFNGPKLMHIQGQRSRMIGDEYMTFFSHCSFILYIEMQLNEQNLEKRNTDLWRKQFY